MLLHSTSRYTLGPEIVKDWGPVVTRVSDDLRKCVVFLGFETFDVNGAADFSCVGTAFFVRYKGLSYLVTVKHVATKVSGGPFAIRANLKNGRAATATLDRADWFYHKDETVDIAAIPLGLGVDADWGAIPEEHIVAENRHFQFGVGIGTETYVVGLFRLLFGRNRNLTIVHTGAIAMMPGDELVPTIDKATNKRTLVEAYLVEAQSLDGLSGSPVFARRMVRHEVSVRGQPVQTHLSAEVGLLGVWQAAWSLPPDDVIAGNLPKGVLVPVGVGLVTPIQKLVDVLEMPTAVKNRDEIIDGIRAQGHVTETQSAPTTKADNPSHKEDFTSLLTSVARGKRQDD